MMNHMKPLLENIFAAVAETEQFSHRDALSNLINAETDNELSEDELEMVSAAGKADYERFKAFYNQKNRK